MSEAENPVIESELVSPQTGKAMVKIGQRGQIQVQSLEGLQRLAWMFCESDIVGECYRASKNDIQNRQHAANCAIACHAALVLGIDLLFFLQHTYIVPGSGLIAIDGQIAIAILNNSPMVKGRIQFTFAGDSDKRWCKASATDATTGESHFYTVTWEDVVLNGWNREKKRRDGSGTVPSQWSTQPELMFRYRSALYLARTAFPDLLMGMRTIDEQEDMEPTGLQSGDTVPPGGLEKLMVDMAAPGNITEAALVRSVPVAEQQAARDKVTLGHISKEDLVAAAEKRAEDLNEETDATFGDLEKEVVDAAGRLDAAEKRADDLFPDPKPDQAALLKHTQDAVKKVEGELFDNTPTQPESSE